MKILHVSTACALLFCINLQADSSSITAEDGLKILQKVVPLSGDTNLMQVQGLKEALDIGVDFAINSLKGSGYLDNPAARIKLPESVQNMANIVAKMGGQKYIDDLEKDINLAAGEAISQSVPIFKKAILDMNVNDATKLLGGKSNSITEYFKSKTNTNLVDVILPIVQKATNKNQLATSYKAFLGIYNSSDLVKSVVGIFSPNSKPMEANDLNGYITQTAIDEVYKMIGQEEAKIRANPMAYSSDVIKKVFKK